MSDFQNALKQLINRHSLENGSNTPDFLLAKYLQGCLNNFNDIVSKREEYFGRVIEDITGDVIVTPITEDTNIPADHSELEKQVLAKLESDPHYPLFEPDAMKWAVAWRLIRDKNSINANGSQTETDIDGWMCGWFANAMASSPDNVKVS